MWNMFFGTYFGSNVLTEKRAQFLAEGLLGGNTIAAQKAAPHISSAAKSPILKAASVLQQYRLLVFTRINTVRAPNEKFPRPVI
jgi:hypothetical protein